jgi:3-hydroxybutyryl-CoA dehydrogenase
MRIFINANEEQEEEIKSKGYCKDAEIVFGRSLPQVSEYKNIDAFFIFDKKPSEINFQEFDEKPVFINSVVETLAQLQLPANVSRVNGWPGFLQRKIWEVASENKELSKKIFDALDWEIIFIKDEPGLVAARVIAMIINEAFYAFKENVSTKKEIDLAMKLGTNYPFGPFEWAEKIGIQNVFDLLKKLSEKEERYIPSFNLHDMEKIIRTANKTR